MPCRPSRSATAAYAGARAVGCGVRSAKRLRQPRPAAKRARVVTAGPAKLPQSRHVAQRPLNEPLGRHSGARRQNSFRNTRITGVDRRLPMSIRAFLLATITAFPLAGPALAGNAGVIVQNGGVSHADVAQSGAANDFTIVQGGYANRSTVLQTGGHNNAMVGQMGRFNHATVGQIGSANGAGVFQMGPENFAGIGQAGPWNRAILKQWP